MRLLTLLGTSLLLCGCAASTIDDQHNTSNLGTTLSAVVQGTPDVVMTAEQVEKIPYASAYFRIGDGAQIFTVLGFVEGDDLKWITADSALLVTRHGRIIKTVGLANDMVWNSDLDRDPLLQLVQGQKPALEWSHTAEWREHYLTGYTLDSRLLAPKLDPIAILDESYQTELWVEEVKVRHSGETWQNRFWFDPKSRRIVRSEQQLGPQMPMISFTLLKGYSAS